jgi:hypothetical protein
LKFAAALAAAGALAAGAAPAALADGPTVPVTVNGTQVCVDTGDNSVDTGPAGVTIGNESITTQPGSVSAGRVTGCLDPTNPPSLP